MTLPGFSAETSLYQTTVHYRLTGASGQADGIVLQQLVFDPCRCRHRCCPTGVCHPGIERSCFLECITFCDE